MRGEEVLKRRVKKGYRLPFLDEKLRKLRTRKEAKLFEKAAALIDVPRVTKVSDKSYEIDMEFIDGKKLSEHLDELKNWREVCEKIGENIAKLHDAGIIHGDLTTSNMIYFSGKIARTMTVSPTIFRNLSSESMKISSDQVARPHPPVHTIDDVKNNNLHPSEKINKKNFNSGDFKVYFIDFGLGFESHKIEDKAVDLHLIKQALEAKHFKNFEKFFEAVLHGYKISKHYKEVMERFRKVETRGRYKEQY